MKLRNKLGLTCALLGATIPMSSALACNAESSKNVKVGPFIAPEAPAAGSAKMEFISEKLWVAPGVSDAAIKAGCTKDTFKQLTYRYNGGDPMRTFDFQEVVAYPVFKSAAANAPAQKVEPPKTASTEATTPAPAVIPLPAAKAPVAQSPELKDAQAKLAAALREKARLEEWSKSLKNRPKGPLSPEDRQLLNDLIALKRDTIPELSNRVKAIDDRLTVIETNKADISWVGENFATRAWAGLITDRMEKVEDVLNPKSPRYIGKGIATAEKDWLEWSLIFVGIPLSLLISLLALFPGLRSFIATLAKGAASIGRAIKNRVRRKKVDAPRPISAKDELPNIFDDLTSDPKVTAMPIPERMRASL